VEMANLLTILIAPRNSNNTELCANCAVQMLEFWQMWVQSFGVGEGILALLNEASISDLDHRFRRLWDLKQLANFTNGVTVPVNVDVIDKVLADVAATPNETEKRAIFKKAVFSNNPLDHAVDLSFLRGKDTARGWFPLTGDVVHPDSRKPFVSPLAPYMLPETRQWGVSGNKLYSKRYVFSCQMSFSPQVQIGQWLFGASIIKAKHQWKEVAILSNGLCGSACSLFASQLQFKEGATVFTYGGIPGHLMDSSAFAGGNVEDFRQWWPWVFFSGLIGDTLHKPDTEIGKMLRAPGAKHRSYSRALMLPLPTKAIARFNYNMMFVPKLGPKALPREWYIMAAHQHYWEWHATSAVKLDTWDKLYGLYARIDAENWTQVRAKSVSRLQSSGISYACASDPPTIPFVRERDWDLVLYPIILSLALCFFACCLCCCWLICCKCGCGKRCQRRCPCCFSCCPSLFNEKDDAVR